MENEAIKISATKIKETATQYVTDGLRPARVDKYQSGKRVTLPVFDPVMIGDLPKLIAFLTHIHKQEGESS